MKKYLLSVAITLVISPLASALDLDAGLANCAAIDSNTERLACFDALSRSVTTDRLDAPILTDSVGRKRERERKKKTAEAENYAITVKSCEHTSASKRIAFTLENGQVWQQKNARWMSLRDCKGAGTITQGYFGYSLRIEAMSKSVGVIRID